MVATSSTRERSLPPRFPEALTPPLALAASLRLTPEEFAKLCTANPDAVLKLAADGSLIPMTPIGSDTGARHGALNGLLWQGLQRNGARLGWLLSL
jgi:Uma2 family endonuclease